jgi:hypothetical protein
MKHLFIFRRTFMKQVTRPRRAIPRLPANVRTEAVLGGGWMVLVNGFQWGGDYDRSGAGNAVFRTKAEAAEAYVGRGADIWGYGVVK